MIKAISPSVRRKRVFRDHPPHIILTREGTPNPTVSGKHVLSLLRSQDTASSRRRGASISSDFLQHFMSPREADGGSVWICIILNIYSRDI